MSDPFIGEIRVFSFNFVPADTWLPCNGQAVDIAQYQALHAVIGYLYGGTYPKFRLPNFNGIVPVGANPVLDAYAVGKNVGSAEVTLNPAMIPQHTHQMQRKSPAAITSKHATPTAASDVGVLAVAKTNTPVRMMATASAIDTTLAPQTIGFAWGNAKGAADPHENRQPFLALTYGIAFLGIFPMRQ